jgi:hypothetical protein
MAPESQLTESPMVGTKPLFIIDKDLDIFNYLIGIQSLGIQWNSML